MIHRVMDVTDTPIDAGSKQSLQQVATSLCWEAIASVLNHVAVEEMHAEDLVALSEGEAGINLKVREVETTKSARPVNTHVDIDFTLWGERVCWLSSNITEFKRDIVSDLSLSMSVSCSRFHVLRVGCVSH